MPRTSRVDGLTPAARLESPSGVFEMRLCGFAGSAVLFVVTTMTLSAPAADRTPAALPADTAAEQMTLPAGFQSTVFAAEPDVVQPVSFCIDSRGRLFVAEAHSYGEWQPTGRDRIIILEDTDGDGRAESRKVFFEGLNYVTGIEVGFGGVWVMSTPKLYFIPDRDGDDRPDGAPEVIFDGFGYKESRHNLPNGFTWGPDGWLYAGHGRTSPSDVGLPGTPAAQRTHCDGGVYRVHPTRRVFENFADGNTNPWGVDFDDFGQCFVSNCVDPHLFHMIQGGHYEPWRGRPSSQFAYERLPTIADHWHFPTGKPNEMRGETPETLAMGGGHAHCGTLIYLGDQFPDRFRNSAMMCNVHGRRINNDLLSRKGSGYVASHGRDFMISADPWFMGVTLKTGPDGSLFVSDWSDTGECHTYKPHRASGRIYKITFGRPEPRLVDLAKLTDLELVDLQAHRNEWHVRQARRLLQERAARPDWNREPVRLALDKMLDKMLDSTELAAPPRLRALWALYVINALDERRLLELLGDRDEHVRAWSIQLLCEKSPPSAALEKFADLARQDSSPVVRLYLASALQRLPLDERWSIAAGLLGRTTDNADANLPLMIWYGVEPLVPAAPARALQMASQAELTRVRQLIGRRAVDDVIARRANADLTEFVAALRTGSDECRTDLLRGAREALRGRKRMPMPANWPAMYARLTQGTPPELRDGARSLALVFDDPRVIADLSLLAADRSAPVAERVAAVEALVGKQVAEFAPRLHELLDDPQVRRAAVRGLASFSHAETPKQLVARYPAWPRDEQQDAIATLASRKEYATALLDALERKLIARGDVSAFIARQVFAYQDEGLTNRLRALWGEIRSTAPQKQAQIAKLKAQLTPAALARADLANGRQLFQKTCQKCHLLFGDGGKIGPDLTGSNRANLDYLLANVVDPSAEISRDFRMSMVVTKDGRAVTGMVIERLPNRITLQTANEKLVLATDEIEQLQESSVSMMPDGQLDTLGKDEIRDLLAYLGAKTQVALPTEMLEK